MEVIRAAIAVAVMEDDFVGLEKDLQKSFSLSNEHVSEVRQDIEKLQKVVQSLLQIV